MNLSEASRWRDTQTYWESEEDRAKRLLKEAERALKQAQDRVKHCKKQVAICHQDDD